MRRLWKKVTTRVEGWLKAYDDFWESHRPETYYVDKESVDVREFQRKFSQLSHCGRPVHLTQRKLWERVDCLREELAEFEDGVARQDLAAQADALIDLVYFAKGTANMLGLPWEALWADVHAANMDKVPGTTKRGHKVDVTKPVGWIPPQTELILENYGYNRRQFTDSQGHIMESRCFDDSNV